MHLQGSAKIFKLPRASHLIGAAYHRLESIYARDQELLNLGLHAKQAHDQLKAATLVRPEFFILVQTKLNEATKLLVHEALQNGFSLVGFEPEVEQAQRRGRVFT